MEISKPSVALVVRIFIGELPYIKPFLDHYLKIGVSKFYVIITDVRDFERIKAFLKEYEPYLNYKVNEKLLLDHSFNIVLKDVKEDYLLNVDVDEFLDVTPHETIQAFIAATGNGDKYTFGWLLNVNDNIADKSLAFEAKGSKQMCRTSLIQSMPNPHKIMTEGPVKEVPLIYNLIHYWGRTFDDIIIKCVYGGHHDLKATSLEGVKKDIAKNRIPNRFKMMAVISRRIKTIKIPDLVTEKIDYALEAELAGIFDQKEKLVELYNKYQANLDYKKHVAIYGDVNLKQLIDYIPK